LVALEGRQQDFAFVLPTQTKTLQQATELAVHDIMKQLKLSQLLQFWLLLSSFHRAVATSER
jgi:hypothetical protein